MSNFMKSGNRYRVSSDEAMDIHNSLPPGSYLLKIDMFGFFLEKSSDYVVNHKIYGETPVLCKRILDTFKHRNRSTGVLLSGLKGSGKTLLTKMLSEEAQKIGFPTIIIVEPFGGPDFNILIQSISQTCILIFDEFEKVYNNEEKQNQILSLLDGLFDSNKLFLFTVNEINKVNNYMLNRPGRIFYHMKFTSLSKQFIEEYCNDNLNNKDHIDGVLRIEDMITNFNFDLLKALIEEMNRYDETASAATKYLNIDVGTKYDFFKIILFKDKTGRIKEPKISDHHTFSANPFDTIGQYIHHEEIADPEFVPNPDESDEENESLKYDTETWVAFEAGNDLKKIDSKHGIYMFENESYVMHIKKHVFSFKSSSEWIDF